MTPKEKAKELINKYMFLGNAVNSIGFAKQCALICVDEIIIQYYVHTDNVNQHTFWQEVKHELRIL